MQGKEKGMMSTGVRYINEDMIQRVTKQNQTELITSLNLTLSREGGKKIKYIENLDKLKKLQTLNLSCNIIEKIEKIDKLIKLRELNISYNALTRIEGIETLVNLQVLNLTGNKIEHIPVWLGKKLKALRVFRISKNNIQSLNELSKLRPLKDLSQLSVAENPVCQLPHCRLFLVFHLRTLETLDGQPIDWNERTTAQARFAQEELEEMDRELEQRDQELAILQDRHNKSLQELEQKYTQEEGSKIRHKQDAERISQLQQALETKNDMLKKRTTELTRACEKHYELEQELAFYKIDHKFETLGKLPSPESGSQEEEGPYDESPYIGKGRFRKNKIAREKRLNRAPQQASAGTMDDASRAHLQAELDRELEEKKDAITSAQGRLQQLQTELAQTEKRMTQVTDELQRLADARMAHTLTEGDKQRMREQLERKVDHVHLLRDEADKIEEEMADTEREIQSQERDIGRLRGQLSSMGSRDSLYSAVSREVADREEQLSLTNQVYSALQQKLEEMLATIARETDGLKRIEDDLHEGQAAQNDAIREELEGVVNGLQDYLADVKRKSDNQRRDMDRLVREREELLQHVAHLEDGAARLPEAEIQVSKLQEQIAELEESLAAQQNLNDSLTRQLDETRLDNEEEANLSDRLHDAEGLLSLLRKQLDEKEAKAKAERDAYEKKLESEHQRAAQLAERARYANMKDEELNNLQRQFTDLQKANTALQQELYAKQEKLRAQKEQKPQVTADDLKQRLDDIYRALKAGKGPSSHVKDDPVDRPLTDFHGKVAHEMDRSFRELDRAKAAAVKAEAEVQALRVKMAERDAVKNKTEQAVQAELHNRLYDLSALQEELEHLRRELEIEKSKHPLPFRLLEPTVRSQSTQAAITEPEMETEVDTESLSSATITSSQWSVKRREVYEQMTPEEQALFDELQTEIDELRRLIEGRTAEASSKAADAQRKARNLRELIRKRKRQQAARQQSKVQVDARLQQAAEDLARAQDEIDGLHEVLRQKDRQLEKQVDQTDRSQLTIADQQKDIDILHDVLDEQRAEIIKLNRMFDQLQSHPAQELQVYDTALEALHQGAAGIRSNIAQQNSRIHNLMPSAAPHPHPYHQPHLEARMPPEPHLHAMQTTAQSMPTTHVPVTTPVHTQPVPVSNGRPIPHMYGPPQRVPEPQYQSVAVSTVAAGNPSATSGKVPIYVPADQQQIQQLPSTPVAQHSMQMTGDGAYLLSAPTTPVAGSGMHLVLTEPTTPVDGAAGAHPVMVSTPVNAVRQADQGDSPVKGILKTNAQPGAADGGLYCNVPEHHTLEDYVSKLQAKVQALKAKLHGQIPYDDTRKVVFEDDINERQAIERLKAELQERRSELEGLDLAIERQKVNLNKMKEAERTIKIQRSAAKRQLQEMQEGKEGRRKAFLDDDLYYELVESDFENPNLDALSKQGRKPFLVDEIDCLEETLARRRAELREADRLIVEAEADLEHLRDKASGTIEEYKEAKTHYSQVLADAEELERRAHDTGVELLGAQEQLELQRSELADLQIEKNTQQQMVREILQVIAVKDAEFQALEAKVKEAAASLAKVQSELSEVESTQREKLQIVTDSDVVLSNQRKELEVINEKILKQRSSLEQLDCETGAKQTEANAITHALDKRRRQLGELTQQVEQELAVKRREMKAVEDALVELREEHTQMERELRDKKSRVSEVGQKLDHEEAVLQSLATTTKKQRSDLADINERTQQALADLDHVLAKRSSVQGELQTMEEEVTEMKRIRSEISHRKVDLDTLKDKVDRHQEELDALTSQRRSLELAINNLRKEKLGLEDSHKLIGKRTVQLQRTQAQAEDEIKTFHTQALSLERELQELEGDVQDARREKSSLKQHIASLKSHLSEGQQELDRVKMQLRDSEGQVELFKQAMDKVKSEHQTETHRFTKHLSEGREELAKVTQEVDLHQEELSRVLTQVTVLKKEAERRKFTQETFANLEQKVQDLAQDAAKRNEEKEQLATALQRSSEELKVLRSTLTKERESNEMRIRRLELDVQNKGKRLQDQCEELQRQREKSASQIADLEAIAQMHYSHANRLNDELNLLRAEHLQLQRHLQAQSAIIEQDRKLESTLEELRADIKADVAGGMLDLSRTQMEAATELEELYEQKENIESHLDTLKQTLSTIRSSDRTEPVTRDVTLNTFPNAGSFTEQQNLLKAQLQQNMLNHEENLQTKRLASQDHIRNLQLKLSGLEKALSSRFKPENDTLHSTPTPLSDQQPTKDIEKPKRKESERHKNTKEPSSPKRAYSPNRHSMRRQQSRSPSPSSATTGQSPSPQRRSPSPKQSSKSPPPMAKPGSSPEQRSPAGGRRGIPKLQQSPSPPRKQPAPSHGKEPPSSDPAHPRRHTVADTNPKHRTRIPEKIPTVKV